MEDCVFCRIVEGKEKSFKIYEDKDFIAILDLFPNIEGQTLLITKKHVDSYAFDLSNKDLSNIMVAAKKVAKILEKGLDAKRVHMVIEGVGINHFHVKLYPAIGMKDKNETRLLSETVHFDKYAGYITTLMGPKAEEKDLKGTQNKILSNINNINNLKK